MKRGEEDDGQSEGLRLPTRGAVLRAGLSVVSAAVTATAAGLQEQPLSERAPHLAAMVDLDFRAKLAANQRVTLLSRRFLAETTA